MLTKQIWRKERRMNKIYECRLKEAIVSLSLVRPPQLLKHTRRSVVAIAPYRLRATTLNRGRTRRRSAILLGFFFSLTLLWLLVMCLCHVTWRNTDGTQNLRNKTDLIWSIWCSHSGNTKNRCSVRLWFCCYFFTWTSDICPNQHWSWWRKHRM